MAGCIQPVPEGGQTKPGSAGSGASSSDPGVCPQPTVAPITNDVAIKRAKALLTDLGIDASVVSGATYDVSHDEGSGSTYATVSQQLPDGSVGATWSISWVGDQVSSVSGVMAPLVPLDTMDVISPAAAVARLSDPRFGQMMDGSVWGGPVPMGMAASTADGGGTAMNSQGFVPPAGQRMTPGRSQPGWSPSGGVSSDGSLTVSSSPGAPINGTGTSDTSTSAPAPDPTPPATLQPGDPIPWPVQQVTITSALLVVVPYTLNDGAVALLPAYRLTSADGGSWTVLALTDSALDFTAPSAAPTVDPTK
jgi:hypothetical protein